MEKERRLTHIHDRGHKDLIQLKRELIEEYSCWLDPEESRPLRVKAIADIIRYVDDARRTPLKIKAYENSFCAFYWENAAEGVDSDPDLKSSPGMKGKMRKMYTESKNEYLVKKQQNCIKFVGLRDECEKVDKLRDQLTNAMEIGNEDDPEFGTADLRAKSDTAYIMNRIWETATGGWEPMYRRIGREIYLKKGDN